MKKLFFLLLTAVCAMLYAPPSQADTLYFYNENWNSVGFTAYTNTPHVYFVQGTNNNEKKIAMTRVPGESLPIWKVDYTRSGNIVVIFSNGDGWGDQTDNISINNPNGKRFRINYKSNNKWNGSWDSYTPPVTVTVSSVQLLKSGASVGTDASAPYQFALSDLTGNETYQVKVNLSDGTSKTYTVSSGANLTEGSGTFQIDSKIISATMTVNVANNAATSYSLSNVTNNAITGVYLGSQKMSGSNGTYTLSGVSNATTGYTVKVTTTRNAAGTTYTVASGSNLAAGTHTLTAGTTAFTVASSLPTFGVSVAVNTSTLAATSVTISDPNATISAVKLVNNAGTAINLTSKNGITWTVNTKVNAYDDGIGTLNTDYKKSAAYQIVVTNAGVQEKYYYTSSDYGLEANNTYSNSWKTTTGINFFRFAKAGNTDTYKITVTLNSAKKAVTSLRYEKYTAPAANVYMPLTEDDFQDGPRYFLVGNRTADWRLQPEWELKPDGNGNVTLSGRLMYQQCFAIAKVSSYANYIAQRYVVYTNNNYWVNDANHTNIPLTADTDHGSQGVRYDKVSSDIHPADKRLKWMVDRSDWSPDSWTQTTPTYLKKVTVTLTREGNPDKLSFDYEKSGRGQLVNNARTFSITGENIRYQGNFTFPDGTARDLSTMTPGSHLTKNSDDNSNRWGNHWVQTDKNGRPYVDGNGDLVYNTAFDQEWLSEHTVRFYNEAKDLQYTSMNTTFMLADPNDPEEPEEFQALYRAHPLSNSIGNNSIGDKVTVAIQPLSYTENFDENFKDGRNTITNEGWKCYVVKDMWLEGEFKIWTGWGGNMKKYNYVDDGKYDTAEQWFYENAGHQDKNTTKNVYGYDITKTGGAVTLYPTRRDQEQANFKIPNMTYFSRVILWYNPTDGCSNSVLQFVRSIYGPNIQAFPNLETRNTLRYEWWIDTQDSSNDDKTIVKYTVTRYKVEGTKFTNPTVIEADSYTQQGTSIGKFRDDSTTPPTFINKIEFKDVKNGTIKPGQYVYRIRVTFSDESTKEATSNVVTINEVSVPVTISAKQTLDENNNYEFGVTMTMEPNTTSLDQTIGESGVKVKDAMQYYVLNVGAPTARRLNDATNADGIKFKQAATDYEVLISDGSYLPAGSWYYKHEITDKEHPVFTTSWSDVAPNATGYGLSLKTWTTDSNGNRVLSSFEGDDRDYVAKYVFRAYLVSKDSEIDEWALLNFDVAQATTDVIAPAAKLTVENLTIAKVDETAGMTYNPMDTNDPFTHLSGSRLYNPECADDRRPEKRFDTVNEIVYKRLNETVADATVSALPIAESVAKPSFDLYLVPGGTVMTQKSYDENYALVFNYNNGLYGAKPTIDTPTKTTKVKFYDVNLDKLPLTTSVDGYNDNVIDALKTEDNVFDSHILVTYTLNGRTFVNNADLGDRNIILNHGISSPTVSAGDIAYTRYHDQYYHNGPAGTNNPDTKPCTCGQCTKPGHESLGFYAHAVIDFNVRGVDNDTKNGYVAFHAQQKVHGNDKHYGGCYAEDQDNPTWYRHQFAGTRAANGGAPVGEWVTEFTKNGNIHINPLSYDGTVYTDYDKRKDKSWEDKHDWSTMGAKSGHLPLHINPIGKLSSLTDASKDFPELTAKFSAVYPVIISNGIGIEVVAPEPAASNRNGMRHSSADVRKEIKNVVLFGAPSTVTISDWNLAEIQTGVEDIMGDSDDNAPAEYYNLQGMRVMNPAKGQIYIVRRGSKVSKVLYK